MNTKQILGESAPTVQRSFSPSKSITEKTVRTIRSLAILVVVVSGAILLFSRPAHAQDAVVQVAKTVSHVEVLSGQPFTYTLFYKCASINQNCVKPVMTDVLPPGLRYVDDSAIRTVDISTVLYEPDLTGVTGGTVKWIFKDPMPAGTTGVVQFAVRFAPGTLAGTKAVNTATLTSTTASSPSISPPVTTTVLPGPGGTISMNADKTMVSSEVISGFPAIFNLAIIVPDNPGNANLTNPVIVDRLPISATFVGAQGLENSDWTYTPYTVTGGIRKGGVITFTNIPTAVVGIGVSRQITLQFDFQGVTVTNVMTATGTQSGTIKTATDSLPIRPIGPYRRVDFSKTSSSPSSYVGTEARPGELVTYTLRAENTGYLPIERFVVTDTIPAGLDPLSWTTGGTPTQPVTVSYRISGTTVFTIVPGSPFTTNVTIPASIAAPNQIAELRWEIGSLPERGSNWTS